MICKMICKSKVTSAMQTAPDMLNIGDGTHVGDMANMVSSLAIDASSMLVAPIDIGKQVGSVALLQFAGSALHDVQ